MKTVSGKFSEADRAAPEVDAHLSRLFTPLVHATVAHFDSA